MKVGRVVIIVVIIIVVVAGVFLYIYRGGSSDDGTAASLYIPDEPGVAVEAVEAQYGMAISTINASGLIRGKNEAVIISETRGNIVEVYAEIGSFIDKGDAVLSVDSNVAKLSMLQAEQQFKSAEIDYNSVKRAYDGGSASEAELVRVQGQFAGAEALYRDAVKRYQNTVVKAPFDGYLADMESSIGIGSYISEGARIGRVIDLSGIKVDLFLGDDEVRRIKQGAKALIETGSKQLEGQVAAIALSSDKSTGSFRVIIEAANPYGVDIRSGFSADVSIDLADNPTAIIIPASSVFDIGPDKYVYIIEENTAILRKIKPGTVSGNRLEVVDGIDAGESVVASGLKSLSDGAAVIPSFLGGAGGRE